MKTVVSAALAELSKRQGTEPLIIVGIQWVEGKEVLYADKTLDNVKGKILDFGDIDSVSLENSVSTSVDVTLDDTDGEIKSIIDDHNTHKVKCVVYQYYEALANLSQKFKLLEGFIETPFTWNEKDRTVAFTINSEIESFEVGFSPEEGQLDFVSDDQVGQPWPLCFGNVIHVPAQRVNTEESTHILEDLCAYDPILKFRIANLQAAYGQAAFLLTFWQLVIKGADAIAPKANDVLVEYVKTVIIERTLSIMMNEVANGLNQDQVFKRRGIEVPPAVFLGRVNDLDFLGNLMNVVQQRKAELTRLAELCEFKHELKQKAFNAMVGEYNKMLQIYAEYLEIVREYCRQQACVKNTIIVDDSSDFPQNESIDIFIEGMRFRGFFNDKTFTITARNLAQYQDIPVDSWLPDPDWCQEDSTDGAAVFWLANDPPESLQGMYLLVKARHREYYQTPDREMAHIIKVSRQDGRKIVYELVPWEQNGSGGSRGISIDSMTDQLLDVPLINTNFGWVPADALVGDWNASIWNQPNNIRVLNIINSIPLGVTEEEFRVIVKLVYLSDYDGVSNSLILDIPGPERIYTIIGKNVGQILEAAAQPLEGWFNRGYTIPHEEVPDTAFWKANAGSVIKSRQNDCAIYIANILPSTIKAVYAYRTFIATGQRLLVPVPSSYYTKLENHNLGTIDVTALVFREAIQNLGEGWEEDIYVTLSSSVGPRMTDIIEHLIDTYTIGGEADADSFSEIETKFGDLYPMNFCLLDRPNVLDEINRIAWEGRCAIYRRGNKFVLKYLSEEPEEDTEITEADIDIQNHFQMVYPNTDGIVTRMVALWKPNYLPLQNREKPYRLIYRHNVKLYGMKSEDIEFHCYNQKELVEKSATFWLIRKSNTWKRVTFTTFMTNIQLEVFDTVNVALARPFLSDEHVKAVVQSVVYNTENNSIAVELELPIKSGSMEPYLFYWPANTPSGSLFPTVIEIESGYAGGYGPGSGVQGTIDGCTS